MSEISTWAGRIATLVTLMDDDLSAAHFPNPSALFRALEDKDDRLGIRAKMIKAMLPDTIKVSHRYSVNGKSFYLGHTELPGFTYGDYRQWLPYTDYCLVPLDLENVPGLRQYLEQFTGVHLVDLAIDFSRSFDHGLSDEFLSPNPDGHPANYRLIHENFGWSRGTFVVLQDFDYAHQFQHVTRERIHYYRKLDPQLALNFGLLAQILQAHNGKLRTQLPDEPAEYHGLKELLGDSYEDLRVVDITHPQSGWRFPYWGPSLGVAKYTTQATELVRDTDVWMSVDEEIPF